MLRAAHLFRPRALVSAWARRLDPERPLVWRRDVGARLDEAALREMWRLRTSIFALKPEVSPEADFAWFAGVLRRSTDVYRFFAGEHLVGFWEVAMQRTSVGARACLVVNATYAFTHLDYRGHPALALTAVRGISAAFARARGAPIYGLGVAYPNTWLLLARHGLQLVVDGADGDALAARLLALYRGDVAGVGGPEPRPVVSMNTVPETPSPAWLARHRDHPAFLAYQRLNPRWAEGFGIYTAARVHARFFASIALSVARRTRR